MTGLTLSIAAIYYTFTLKYTRANMKNTLETRQATLMMNIFRELTSERRWEQYIESAYVIDLADYEDFHERYGRNNPKKYSQILSLWWSYTIVGGLLFDGLLDDDKVYHLMGTMIITQWEKWGEIIRALREDLQAPAAFMEFEYLYNRMKLLENKPGYLEKRISDLTV